MYGMTTGYVAWILTLAIACPTALLAFVVHHISQTRQAYHRANQQRYVAEAARDNRIAAASNEAIAKMEAGLR